MRRRVLLGAQWCSFFFFLWLFSTEHFGTQSCRNDVCWNRPQKLAADIHADSRDQKEVVEHGISLIFGKGLLLKSGSLSVNFRCLSNVIYTPTSATEGGLWAEYWAVGRPLLFGLWPSPKHKKCRARAKASGLNRRYWSTLCRATQDAIYAG